MSDPFTIRIFVPDGDPEGIKIIDRMNWTGLGIVFPRSRWHEVKQRSGTLFNCIEPYGDGGKYKLFFSEKAQPIGPIPYADAAPGSMQGPRYTSFERLRTAKKLTELIDKN